MIESILIKNVSIFLKDEPQVGDVFISGGKIQAVDWHLDKKAELIIDEPGLTLLPGIIDGHVHFREPGLTSKEDFVTGSRAAAAGGVTTVLEMPNTVPPTTTRALFEQKIKLASAKSLVNFNFFLGATADNLEELNSIPEAIGIKIFMASSTGQLLVDQKKELEKIFASGSKLIAVHAEDEEIIKANQTRFPEPTIFEHEKIRSRESALSALTFAIGLAKKYQRRLHICHVSSKEEAAYLAKHKIPGLISAEVTPQHLSFYGPDFYKKFGNLAKINPPIRAKEDQHALFKALKNGVIDLIATDHAPHSLQEKLQDYAKAPSGMPMVELSLPVMLDKVNQNECTLAEVVQWMSVHPARCFGLKAKGFIVPGFDADLVLVDLKKQRMVQNQKLYSRAGWNIFNNYTLQGWPVITIVNGQIVFREGDFFEEVRGALTPCR